MSYKTKNIIVGAGAFYISVNDSTQNGYVTPDPFSLSAPTAGQSYTTVLDGSADWRSVGFTDGGIEVSYEPNYADVQVDQLLDAARIFKQSMKVTVKTTLSETTLDNLVVSWGQGSATLASTTSDSTLGIAAGALGDDPVERAVTFVGPAPKDASGNKRERVYFVRRVISVDTTAHGLRRDQATTFPVSFRCLPDPSAALDKEYGVVKDRQV